MPPATHDDLVAGRASRSQLAQSRLLALRALDPLAPCCRCGEHPKRRIGPCATLSYAPQHPPRALLRTTTCKLFTLTDVRQIYASP